MTPEQLRASILQYAAEGKLVKQNPNDEPASELIRKIEKEKNKLIKEGKIKKNKKLPAIEKDEKPFDIPDSWEWVRLDTVLDVRDGTHDTPKYVENGIPLITSKNISNGHLDFSNIKYISEKDFTEINKRSNVEKGDIIFAMIGSIGNPVIVDTDRKFGIKNVALLKNINHSLDMNFVLHYLYLLENLWIKNASGAVQKFISLKKIRASLIPFPPLEEQKRIVAKIEKLMPLVDEYAKSYNRLQKIDNEFGNQFMQSVFQYAMEGKLVKQNPNDEPASELIKKIENERAELIKEGKIKKSKKLPTITNGEKTFDIPNSWEWIRLGDILQIYTGLSYKKTDLQTQPQNMVRILRGGNINGKNHQTIFKDDDKFISPELINNNDLYLKKDQLLTPSVTSDKRLGKVSYVSKDYPDTVAGGFVFNLVPFYHNETLAKYIMFVYSSKYIKDVLLDIANKSGQAFYNVSKTKLKKVCIPLPPLEEQKRIVLQINKLENSINNLSN